MAAFDLDSWFGSLLPWTCLKFGFLMEFPEIEVKDKSRILFDVAREDSFERMESERTEGVRENYLESACMSYTGPFLPQRRTTAWKTCASILFSPCCYACFQHRLFHVPRRHYAQFLCLSYKQATLTLMRELTVFVNILRL